MTHYARAQKGFSLIELMVALVLGLTITYATLNVYSVVGRSWTTQGSDARMTETGTIALATLSRHLRNAGYADWVGNAVQAGNLIQQIDPDSYFLSDVTTKDALGSMAQQGAFGASWSNLRTLHGCNGSYTNVDTLTDFSCVPTSGTTVSPTQSITVAYQVLSSANPASASVGSLPATFDASTGQSGDCNNQNAGAFAINRFFVSNNTLFCLGNGGTTAQPVINDIEQLVFLYGEAQTTTPALPTAAASVAYSADLMVGKYSNATQNPKWPLVTSVVICLVVRGKAGALPAGTTAPRYTDCLGNSVTPTDQRSRMVFRSTVSLRNQLRTTP